MYSIENSTKNGTSDDTTLSSNIIVNINKTNNTKNDNDNVVRIQKNPKESKMNPKESKRIRNVSYHDKMVYICKYCNKKFTTNSNMNRHINKKRCKIQNEENLSMKKEILEIKTELDKAINKISDYKNKMVIANNNSNNNYYNNIDTMNMNNINNLNVNFGNVIPMETFLYNMEHVNKIPEEDIDNLVYTSQHMGIEDIANCFEKIISKNCIEQTKNMVTDSGIKMLPTIPVLCTDGSMRSHKERLLQSWDTIYNDKHFSKMWDIVNNRVYELKNEYIFVSNKHKKKLYSKIKKKVTIDDLYSLNN